MLRRGILLVALAAAGVTALAYDASVDVSLRWRVLPYQSLRVIEPGTGGDPSGLLLPRPEGADSIDGSVEELDALRLHVASNVPWTLQLRLDDSTDLPGLEARSGGGEYSPLSGAPVVMASGSHGAYDVTVDLRWPAGTAVEAQGVRLIATIMPK